MTQQNLVQEPGTHMNQQNDFQQHSKSRSSMAGTKFTIFLVFIFSVAALVGAGVLFQTLNVEKRERASLEASRLQLRDQVKTLQEQNEQFREEAERMGVQLKAYADEQATWKDQIKESRAEIEALEKQLEDAKQQLQQFSVPLTGTGDAAVAAASKTAVAAAAPGAKVVTVNRNFSFVVLNLGAQDEVKAGDTFNVRRGETSIGQVQIEKVYDRFSAATILKESDKQSIQEGDSVLRA